MHVAIVGQLPHDRARPEGGVSALVASLIRGLVRSGVRVTAIEWGSRRSGAFHDDYFECTVIPLRLRRPGTIANWLLSSREVNRIADDVQPDLVHVECVPELGWAVKHPRVFGVHGLAYRDEWLYGKLRRFVTVPLSATTYWMSCRRFRHILINNPCVLNDTGPIRFARVYEIENAVEDCFFEAVHREFTPTVLFVGRLSALKNTLGVVQAAAKVRRAVPDVRFRLVGPWSPRDNPAYRRKVEQFCEKEGLRGCVEFLGLLTREEIVTELENAACLFLPSFQECAPVVISEAMAAGVPSAASRIAGIPWMVDQGRTGFLFDPHDLDEMVGCLIKMLSDRCLWERMSREARREAMGRFRPEIVGQRHIPVYAEIINDYRRGTRFPRRGPRASEAASGTCPSTTRPLPFERWVQRSGVFAGTPRRSC